ncbi:MAG TPA: hypothetical protein VJA94_19030 [Candidatus Angelobacter sp.]
MPSACSLPVAGVVAMLTSMGFWGCSADYPLKTYREQGMEPSYATNAGYEGATAAVKHVEEGMKAADKK